MSVWATPCYKDDALQTALRFAKMDALESKYILSLCDFDIGDPGEHKLPLNIKKGNFREQVMEDGKVDKRKLLALRATKQANYANEVSKLFLDLDETLFGLKAVWYVAETGWHRKGYEKDSQVGVRDVYKVGVIAGEHTPSDAIAKSESFGREWESESESLVNYFNALLRLATGYRNRKHARACREARMMGDKFPELTGKDIMRVGAKRAWSVFGMLILEFPQRTVTLLRNDISRVEKILKGVANALCYSKIAAGYDQFHRYKFVAAYKSYYDQVFRRSRDLSFNQLQSLVRACDVAYHLVLSQFAADIDNHSYLVQAQKVEKEKLHEIIDVPSLANIVTGMKMREALDVMQAYKAFPQPDFDCYGQAKRQQDLYAAVNRFEETGFTQTVLDHYKLLMIKAYFERHHRCPGVYEGVVEEKEHPWTVRYPNCNPDAIPAEMTRNINFSGAFVMRERPVDALDLVKDKAICPKNIQYVRDDSELNRLPKHERNYLLNYVQNYNAIRIRDLRGVMDTESCHIKCDDKPEAKKPNGRWFMEAHTNMRLLISEVEEAVADYGKHIDGFILGKSIVKKIEMMNHITEGPTKSDESATLYISFDIEKFSPRFPLQVHKVLDKLWANAFGLPHVEKLHRILTDDKIHYIKRNIHHTIDKQGNDYEGFFGKRLTLYHLAVMHAANEVLKRGGWINRPGRYACQIDDGLMRLQCIRKLDNNTMNELRELLAMLWKSAGMDISWDKTFISHNMATFLNEVYFGARRVETPVKAVMKISNLQDSPCPSFVGACEMSQATARGAIVAGCQPTVAYWFYIRECYDSMMKYAGDRYTFSPKKVVWLFAPLQLGGGGIRNMMDMLGSLSFDPVQSCLASLKRIAHRFPTMVPLVSAIVNQKMREGEAIGACEAINAVKREGTVMIGNRGQLVMRDYLTVKMSPSVLGDFRVISEDQLSAVYRDCIANEIKVPYELRELVSSSLPDRIADSVVKKVTNSRTAYSLVPIGKLLSAVAKDLYVARRVINNW